MNATSAANFFSQSVKVMLPILNHAKKELTKHALRQLFSFQDSATVNHIDSRLLRGR